MGNMQEEGVTKLHIPFNFFFFCRYIHSPSLTIVICFSERILLIQHAQHPNFAAEVEKSISFIFCF